MSHFDLMLTKKDKKKRKCGHDDTGSQKLDTISESNEAINGRKLRTDETKPTSNEA